MVDYTKVFCFGEVLWDVVGEEELAGGAPLNVAYHLAKDARYEVCMISSVGCDEPGRRMRNLIADWGIDTRFMQVNEHYDTGRVVANITDKENVSYEILSPVAWDYINWDSELYGDTTKDACLVYGSLATRNAVSKESLYRLLPNGSFNVFDVNFRAGFYDGPTLAKLLDYTDLLKLSEAELATLTAIFHPGLAEASEEEQLNKLMTRFWIGEVIVTRGAHGAMHMSSGGSVEVPGVPVTVADTIGSGDAFLAGYLRYRLAGAPVRSSLENAAALGAFNAQLRGGCPPYALTDFEQFKTDNRL